MLEIIAMFSIGKTIRNIAQSKGLVAWKYITLMILLWVFMELMGAMVGYMLFEHQLAAYLCAMIGAALGATIAYQIVKNAPEGEPTSD